MLFIFVLLVCCGVSVNGVREGDVCNINGSIGICKDLRKCPSAIQDIKNRKRPEICEFKGHDTVVCCQDDISANSGHDSATKTEDGCGPIPAALTASKTGRKAWDKCIEYQQLVFPCQKSPVLSSGMVRQNKCHHGANELVVGNRAGRYEFNHAALLGFGDKLDTIDWLCGGALISERFILTAAHCTTSRERGLVTYAALHASDRADIETKNLYKIKKIINHPEFRSPRTYHDIALLELEAAVHLDSMTVPACLITSESESDSTRVISTTWNTNDILATNVTRLQKIYLTKYSTADCAKIYPEIRRGGFNQTTQLCYGDRTASRDICQDDGGNPLLLENRKLYCMYTIVGITSYGKGCFNHSPGVYTKVEPYVPWIESVVWP